MLLKNIVSQEDTPDYESESLKVEHGQNCFHFCFLSISLLHSTPVDSKVQIKVKNLYPKGTEKGKGHLVTKMFPPLVPLISIGLGIVKNAESQLPADLLASESTLTDFPGLLKRCILTLQIQKHCLLSLVVVFIQGYVKPLGLISAEPRFSNQMLLGLKPFCCLLDFGCYMPSFVSVSHL